VLGRHDQAEVAGQARRARHPSTRTGVRRQTGTTSIVLLILVRVDADLATARRRAAAHLQSQYRLPLAVVDRWSALGSPARVAEQLQAYLHAGVSEVILMPLGPDPITQYERLAEVRRGLGPAAVRPGPGGPGGAAA